MTFHESYHCSSVDCLQDRCQCDCPNCKAFLAECPSCNNSGIIKFGDGPGLDVPCLSCQEIIDKKTMTHIRHTLDRADKAIQAWKDAEGVVSLSVEDACEIHDLVLQALKRVGRNP